MELPKSRWREFGSSSTLKIAIDSSDIMLLTSGSAGESSADPQF
jgi:hypothetical protein